MDCNYEIYPVKGLSVVWNLIQFLVYENEIKIDFKLAQMITAIQVEYLKPHYFLE